MDLQPSLPPKGVRAKVIAGIALIVIVVGLNYVGAALWPQHAKFFPPSLLLMCALLTAFDALMVWRTEWMVSKLFPGEAAPPVRPHDRLAAWIGVVFTVVLAALWVRSLLAT